MYVAMLMLHEHFLVLDNVLRCLRIIAWWLENSFSCCINKQFHGRVYSLLFCGALIKMTRQKHKTYANLQLLFIEKQ